MKQVLLLLILSTGIIFSVVAQPQLVKDVNQNTEYTGGSPTSGLINLNGTIIMQSGNGTTGAELWKSDGTEGGTVLIEDINPGSPNSLPQFLTIMNGVVYFSADNGKDGAQLWKSDGTSAGTVPVKIIQNGGSPRSLTVVGSFLYFSAFDVDHGRELWRSDGTESGTIMIKDINSNLNNGLRDSPLEENLVNVNGTLFFNADNGVHGLELWRSDGTEAGTVMVKDISSGIGSSNFNYLTNINGLLYFNGSMGNGVGQTLWKSDGTESGTKMILPNQGSRPAANITAFKNEVYFQSYATPSGVELWKTDGTENGTALIKDINPGTGIGLDGGISNFKVFNNELYFSANNGILDQQLWKTDGTEEGTVLVKQINPSGSAFIQTLYISNNTLFFSAVSNTDQELWKTDGTSIGTTLVKNINLESSSSPQWFTEAGGILYFVANDGIHSSELWKSDGTELGTTIVKDANKSSIYSPQGLRIVNNSLFFINNENNHSYQVWKSDGTEEGTAIVKDINPGTALASLSDVTTLPGNFIFNMNDGVHGSELWKSDGTEVGTDMIKDINPGSGSSNEGAPVPGHTLVNGITYFTADDGIHGNEIWKSDGTGAGTSMVKDLKPGPESSYANNIVSDGQIIYFFKGGELWKSDGTELGTAIIKNLSSTGYSPGYLINSNGVLFFVADDGVNGREIWKSDGTESGTMVIKDIFPGSDNNHFISILGAHNNQVYFSASDIQYNYELWKTDGTEAGTQLIKDINQGQSGSNPYGFLVFNDEVYFTASEPIHGAELWKTDGTTNGTTLVKDINPGSQTSQAAPMAAMNGRLYLSANDGIHGTELWQSDGTETGTMLVYDIGPGNFSGSPYNAIILNNELFFTADDNLHGRELWKFNPRHQVLNFNLPEEKFITDSLFALSATSTSGLPVSFTIVSGSVTLAGNILSLSGIGKVTIKAFQEGNANYDAVAVERSFNVIKAPQTITFESIPDQSDSDPFEISAVASSGLPVSFEVVSGPAEISNKTVSIKNSGLITIRATQPGNETYEKAENVDRSFTSEIILGLELNMSRVVLYPNPVSQTLYLDLDEDDKISEIALMNSIGQLIFEHPTNHEQQISIPVNHLPKGIYFLQLKGKEGNSTKKVVIE